MFWVHKCRTTVLEKILILDDLTTRFIRENRAMTNFLPQNWSNIDYQSSSGTISRQTVPISTTTSKGECLIIHCLY